MTVSVEEPSALRRWTGALFTAAALTFGTCATILSSTFDWPDILREEASVVIPAFIDGGASLVWTWFATGWTYAILLVPVLLLPKALGLSFDSAVRVATVVGATSVAFSLIGFLRWVFVVPALAREYDTGDATTRAAIDAAWLAQHQFGGSLLGEHLGQVGAVAWSSTISIIILRSNILPRWLGWIGLLTSAIYLSNQGDILAVAVPGFPIIPAAGFTGSTSWGLRIAALGICVARAPRRLST